MPLPPGLKSSSAKLLTEKSPPSALVKVIPAAPANAKISLYLLYIQNDDIFYSA